MSTDINLHAARTAVHTCCVAGCLPSQCPHVALPTLWLRSQAAFLRTVAAGAVTIRPDSQRELIALLRDFLQCLDLCLERDIIRLHADDGRDCEWDDFPTAHLRFLPVFYYIGEVFLNLFSHRPDEKMRFMRHGLSFFKRHYDICEEFDLLTTTQRRMCQRTLDQDSKLSPEDQRNEKIDRFRAIRDLRGRTTTLIAKQQYAIRGRSEEAAELILEDFDDSEERSLIRSQLVLYALESVDQRRNIAEELRILEFAMRGGNLIGMPSGPASNSKPELSNIWIAPVDLIDQSVNIMTRKRIRGDVFRNRNAPTMTIEEYLEDQVARGIMPADVLKDNSATVAARKAAADDEERSSSVQRITEPEPEEPEEDENETNEEREARLEEKLLHDRGWDDWKDDNPPSGNLNKNR